MLHRMLVGRFPFSSQQVRVLREEILGNALSISERIPDRYKTLLAKMLSASSRDRPSVSELIDML